MRGRQRFAGMVRYSLSPIASRTVKRRDRRVQKGLCDLSELCVQLASDVSAR